MQLIEIMNENVIIAVADETMTHRSTHCFFISFKLMSKTKIIIVKKASLQITITVFFHKRPSSFNNNFLRQLVKVNNSLLYPNKFDKNFYYWVFVTQSGFSVQITEAHFSLLHENTSALNFKRVEGGESGTIFWGSFSQITFLTWITIPNH